MIRPEGTSLLEDKKEICSSVGVVVLHYNGLEDTLGCLASLAPIARAGTRVLVVDNASRVAVADVLRSRFPWCEVIRCEVNRGWAGGNNVGIAKLLRDPGVEHVLLLNNDTVVSPCLVRTMLAAAETHPEMGVLGPVINYMDEPHEVQADGVVYNRTGRVGLLSPQKVPWADRWPPGVFPVDVVNGCCMWIRRRVIECIGGIDERFFLLHEESDFCLRARRAGFRCGVVQAPLVWHAESASFKRDGNRLRRYYDVRNLVLLMKKHPPRFPGERRLGAMRLAFLKLVYYKYCVDVEQGALDRAQEALAGLWDGLRARYGPRRSTSPFAALLFLPVFEAARKSRGLLRRLRSTRRERR